MLKEKQGDSLGSEPSPELVAELASMRRVIDKLKKMVLRQREYLGKLKILNNFAFVVVPVSILTGARDSSPAEPDFGK